MADAIGRNPVSSRKQMSTMAPVNNAPFHGGEAPLISVVIPAFNEGKNIADVLETLRRQTLPPNRFEVIVVDNGSTDDTVEKAHSFDSLLPLSVLSKEKGTISALRNYGATASAGEVLAFLDADCFPGPRWLELGLFRGAENTLWGAHYAIPEDATWVGSVWSTHQATQQTGDVAFIPAGDLFIGRRDFFTLHGFNESLQTSEDVEIAMRARQNGMRVLASPDLTVVHRGTPKTLGRFYRQNRWHGTHVVRMFLANLPSRKNLPIVGLSAYTFAMFWLAVLGAPAGVLLHRPSLCLVPLAGLFLPPVAIGVTKGLKAGALQEIPALCVLYLTYFLSRAASLLHLSARNHR